MTDREQREAARDALIEAIRQARKALIGETLYIGTEAEVEAAIQKGLNQGKTVMENGISKWIDYFVVMTPGKSGSDAYTWDASGNKVKHEKVLVTKDKAGNVTRKSLGFCFKKWDE